MLRFRTSPSAGWDTRVRGEAAVAADIGASMEAPTSAATDWGTLVREEAFAGDCGASTRLYTSSATGWGTRLREETTAAGGGARTGFQTLSFTSWGTRFREEAAAPAVETGGSSIFVANLDPRVDDDALLATFKLFGPIVHHAVAWNAAGLSLGRAQVKFETSQAATAAAEKMNGLQIGARKVEVYALGGEASAQAATRPPAAAPSSALSGEEDKVCSATPAGRFVVCTASATGPTPMV